MSSGVKKELGLGDPRPKASTEQADKFKAAYQAAAAKINESLQYTAAYAEKTKHDPQALRRDKSCDAYQIAMQRIDPTNPSAAQGAIDQVLAGVEGLKSAVQSFKAAAEKAYNAWTGKQGQLEALTDKIREMVDWGHEKASALQQVVEVITKKANERAFEEAVKVIEQLIPKADPIYAEFLKQKAAQEDYEAAIGPLLARLDKARSCVYKSLAAQLQALSGMADPMSQAATAKDYVRALAQLRTLEGKIAEFEKNVADLEAKKGNYDTARQRLEIKLTEASTCKYRALADLDQPIVDLTQRTNAAAAEEKYDEALTLTGELTKKVEEKLAKVAELEAKKAEYETARAALDPKLAEASTCQYKVLADLDPPIADLTSKTDTAAKEEKYDDAVQYVGELGTKVGEKLAKVAEYEAAKAEYEMALVALQPRLSQALQCKYASLQPLLDDLSKQQTEMESKAAEEDYITAAGLVSTLSTNVEAYFQAERDLEAKYQQQLNDAQAQVAKMNSHAQKAHYAAEITAAAGQVTAAKAKGDSGAVEDAMTALKAASSACFRVITAMDMLDKGLDKARAEEVADVSQSLVDSGIDREKALEVGQIMNKGGSGDVGDAKLVAAQVANLPMDVIKDMRAKGTKIVACRGNITDHRTDLKGVKPRGWPAGSKWDTVPGVFLGDTNEVVIATRGHGTATGPEVPKTGNGHGSYDLAAHEVMHGYDHTGTPEKHDDAAFKKSWKADKSKLGPYYTQGGGAGEEEAFAESAARYYGGDPTLKTDWPNLYKYWEEVEKKKKNP